MCLFILCQLKKKINEWSGALTAAIGCRFPRVSATLGAVILSTQKAQALNYGLSLFERLYNHLKDEHEEKEVMMLQTQYRMDPMICRFPNQHVYGGQLQTDR